MSDLDAAEIAAVIREIVKEHYDQEANDAYNVEQARLAAAKYDAVDAFLSAAVEVLGS